MFQNQDTICALATPNGVGAIGVIRLSGSNSYEIVSKVFSKNLVGLKSHTTHFGTISSKNEELIDEVLVAIFLGKFRCNLKPHKFSCSIFKILLLQL